MGGKRFDIFLDAHIGFGIRWMRHSYYPVVISIAVPFVTATFGLGRCVYDSFRSANAGGEA